MGTEEQAGSRVMVDELAPMGDVTHRIITLRGQQVMLDRDLAAFYEVKPFRLREQVKRNAGRFPPDFMFQLTEDEVDALVSQNAIPSRRHLGGGIPYAFTEEGVAALSAVLTGERAVTVSIELMRAFVAMRRFITSNARVFERMDRLEFRQAETDRRVAQVLDAIESGQARPQQGVFFDGQFFDAHRFVSDLFRSAEKSIVIIDNFLDESVLVLLTKRREGVRVLLLTRNLTAALAQDVRKFNEQYPPIEVREFGASHDRFVIIDGEEVYHLGASLKDLGRRWFAFSRISADSGAVLARVGDQVREIR